MSRTVRGLLPAVLVLGGVALLVLLGLARRPDGGPLLGIEFRQQDQLRISRDSAAAYPDARSIGQSFRSDHANLSSVAVQLAAKSNTLPHTGSFHLQAGDRPDAPDILVLPLDAGDFSDNPYLAFHFAPLPGSAGQTYRFRIETADPLASHLSVQAAAYDAYSEGQATADGAPQPGDLSFRTSYTYTPPDLAADIARALGDHAWLIAAALLFLLLPGTLLTLALAPSPPPDSSTSEVRSGHFSAAASGHWSPAERLLAAPALTLLAWPVLLLAGWTAGIEAWGQWLVWAIIALSAAGLLIFTSRQRSVVSRQRSAVSGQRSAVSTPHSALRTTYSALRTPHSALFFAVLGLTLLSRLVTIRDMVAGMGLDAYHHTLVTQLFLDRGGVPHGYAPYAPLASFTYHYGFHAFAAAMGWLAPGNLSVERLMPLAGQLATALPVLSLTLFGWRVLGSRWLGLTAGALAGVVAIFPAFYVNWSRYTQGLGLALLPVAWVVVFDALAPVSDWAAGSTPRRLPRIGAWRTWVGPTVLAGIAGAGMFLTHYRIAAMCASYALLFLGGVGIAAARRLRAGERLATVGSLVQSGLAVAVIALLAVLPWLLNLRADFTTRFAGSADQSNAAYYDLNNMLGDLSATSQLGYWSTGILLALAALGLLICLLRRDWPPLLLAVWFGLHLLWSNPTLLHLPGAGYLDTVTVATSAFIPVCLLAAYPLVWAGRVLLRLAARPPAALAVRTFLGVAGLLVAVVGAESLLPILDVRPYVEPQDMAGMRWLTANTPAGALVAGNGFGQPWGPEAVQGSDAGVWTPVLARRASTLPPVPAYNERLADPAYLRHAVQVVRSTDTLTRLPNTPDAANAWAYLRAQGVGYIYIGSRGGVMDPQVLLAQTDQVRLVFHQDDVWIFSLLNAKR
ncbi:MAG: hypothetical protein ACR2M0_06665 [Chloroflexia bacterium]